jgi:hypothetical protein
MAVMYACTGRLSGRQIKACPPADGRIWPLVHQPQAAGEARRITADALTRWRVPEEVVESARLTVIDHVATAHGVRQDAGRTIHWADLDVTGYAPEEPSGEPLKSVRHLRRSRHRRPARGGRWSSPLVIYRRSM